MLADQSDATTARVGGSSWLLGLVLLLVACDLAPIAGGDPPGVSDFVPAAALQVHGTYVDGQLEVRDAGWGIARRRTDSGSVEADETPGPITGRLLDTDGGVIVERHTSPAGSDPDVAGDIEEPGSFGLFLTTTRPAEVATLQVEVGGQLHEEHVGEPVSVALADVPASLSEPLDVTVTTDASPDGLVAEFHGTHVSGRTLDVHAGTLHLDPTRYGPGAAQVAVLATRGLAADIDHTTTEIAVGFREHLEVTIDQPIPIEIAAGEPYLILSVLVHRYTAPGEARAEHTGGWRISFTSDVDGSLDELNASDGHPELYVATAELTPGDHVITIHATGDGMSGQREIPVSVALGSD